MLTKTGLAMQITELQRVSTFRLCRCIIIAQRNAHLMNIFSPLILMKDKLHLTQVVSLSLTKRYLNIYYFIILYR